MEIKGEGGIRFEPPAIITLICKSKRGIKGEVNICKTIVVGRPVLVNTQPVVMQTEAVR